MSMPIWKTEHTTKLPEDAKEMLRFHLGDDDFNGNIMFAYNMPSKRRKMSTMKVCKSSEVSDFLDKMYTSDWKNYYVTANTFSTNKRRNSNAFSLDNIVIDIDAHDDSKAHSYYHVIDAAIDELLRVMHAELIDNDIIAEPNSIVRTGRGVQLWWKIKQTYAKCDALKVYRYIVENYCNWFNYLIQNTHGISWLQVDAASSKKHMGLFRIPGTTNFGAGRLATCEMVHTYTYELFELADNISEYSPDKVEEREEKKMKAIEEIKRKRMHKMNPVESMQYLYGHGVRRLSWLNKLAEMRKSSGVPLRNNTLLVCYCTCVTLCSMPENNAMAYVYDLNKKFDEPLTDAQIKNCLCTAKKKRGYKFSDTTIIQYLNITPEEQKKIGMLDKPGHDKNRHAARAKRNADKKADRDAAICHAYEETNNVFKAAEIAGCCAATVRKVLKAAGKAFDPVVRKFVTPASVAIERLEDSIEEEDAIYEAHDLIEVIKNKYMYKVYDKDDLKLLEDARQTTPTRNRIRVKTLLEVASFRIEAAIILAKEWQDEKLIKWRPIGLCEDPPEGLDPLMALSMVSYPGRDDPF